MALKTAGPRRDELRPRPNPMINQTGVKRLFSRRVRMEARPEKGDESWLIGKRKRKEKEKKEKRKIDTIQMNLLRSHMLTNPIPKPPTKRVQIRTNKTTPINPNSTHLSCMIRTKLSKKTTTKRSFFSVNFSKIKYFWSV